MYILNIEDDYKNQLPKSYERSIFRRILAKQEEIISQMKIIERNLLINIFV